MFSNGSIIPPSPSVFDKKVYYISNGSVNPLSVNCEEKVIHNLNAGKWIKMIASAHDNQWFIVCNNE